MIDSDFSARHEAEYRADLEGIGERLGRYAVEHALWAALPTGERVPDRNAARWALVGEEDDGR